MANRILNLYDFPDYPEFSETYDDSWPTWYTLSEEIALQESLCRVCGTHMPRPENKTCSHLCKIMYKWAIHDNKISSMRRAMHRHFDFECQECQCHLSYTTKSGVELPIHSGEIDHIIPLRSSGPDEISNLQLLCGKCHTEKSIKERKDGYYKKGKKNKKPVKFNH